MHDLILTKQHRTSFSQSILSATNGFAAILDVLCQNKVKELDVLEQLTANRMINIFLK